MTAPPHIPLNIVTGFLGAGKTTLLNALVGSGELSNAVILINEFGDVALDHLLVEGVEGDMIVLAAGCLCCTVRGELVSALEDLLRRRDNRRMRAFDRVVIETTGLADPTPVLEALIRHPYLSQRFVIDSIVTVIDAVNGRETIEEHIEARRQVAVADRLVVAKSDLADDAMATKLVERLRELNPAASVWVPSKGLHHGASLMRAGLLASDGCPPDLRGWLNAEAVRAQRSSPRGHAQHHHHAAHHHDGGIKAFCLTSDRPLDAGAIDLFLKLLKCFEPRKILRLKGIVALTERPDAPLILHGAQHVVHEPVRFAKWPDGERSTRVVLIAQDVSEEELRAIWAAVLNEPQPDRADRRALLENPLAISRGGLLG
jgi:G3E family GTPase